MADDLAPAGGSGRPSAAASTAAGPAGAAGAAGSQAAPSTAAGPAGASPAAAIAARRTLGEVLRYVLGIAVGLLVLYLLFGKRSELTAAVRQLRTVSAGWVAAAAAAETVSLLAYAWLQQRVLRLAGTRVRLRGLFLLTLANDAISCTVPGEPAVSSGYRFRYYRRSGVSAAGAGWTVFTILVAQAVAMSLVLLAGVLIALTATAVSDATGGHGSAGSLGVTVLGLLIVLSAGAVLVRRDLVLGLLTAVTARLGRLRRHAAAGGLLARIERTLARMRDIPLTPRATAGVVALATAVWAGDFLCLVCGFRAVHAPVPWHGVLLAYGAAQVAGALPIVPGGLGIVEGSLAVILVGYGAGRVPAVSAVLAYRIVNYWLAVAVGWVSVGLIAGHLRRRPAEGSAAGADAAG